MSDPQTVSGAVEQAAAPFTPDQYLARAAETELNYARQSIREMQQSVERLKKTAENIIRQCDWLLTGVDNGEPDDD